MTKEEKIKEAYREYWETVKDYVERNGWLTVSDLLRLKLPIFKHIQCDVDDIEDIRAYRPKSLKGIENNNGWIKIESEKILFEKPENCLFEWYNIFDKRYDVGEHFNYGVFTHFKVIPEPVKELPLY